LGFYSELAGRNWFGRNQEKKEPQVMNRKIAKLEGNRIFWLDALIGLSILFSVALY